MWRKNHQEPQLRYVLHVPIHPWHDASHCIENMCHVYLDPSTITKWLHKHEEAYIFTDLLMNSFQFDSASLHWCKCGIFHPTASMTQWTQHRLGQCNIHSASCSTFSETCLKMTRRNNHQHREQWIAYQCKYIQAVQTRLMPHAGLEIFALFQHSDLIQWEHLWRCDLNPTIVCFTWIIHFSQMGIRKCFICSNNLHITFRCIWILPKLQVDQEILLPYQDDIQDSTYKMISWFGCRPHFVGCPMFDSNHGKISRVCAGKRGWYSMLNSSCHVFEVDVLNSRAGMCSPGDLGLAALRVRCITVSVSYEIIYSKICSYRMELVVAKPLLSRILYTNPVCLLTTSDHVTGRRNVMTISWLTPIDNYVSSFLKRAHFTLSGQFHCQHEPA